MGTNRSHDSLARAVERQSGACRALAQAMRADADLRGPFGRRERKLINGWAVQLDLIAEALTEALAEDALDGIGFVSRMGRVLAIPLAVVGGFAGGMSQGFGQAAYLDYFHDSMSVMECAAQVEATAAAVDRALAANMTTAPAAARESAEFGPALRRFRQSIHHDQELLASVLGTSPTRIKMWENGETTPTVVDLTMIRKLAQEQATDIGWALVGSIDGLIQHLSEQSFEDALRANRDRQPQTDFPPSDPPTTEYPTRTGYPARTEYPSGESHPGGT